jgi:hypothetical protein
MFGPKPLRYTSPDGAYSISLPKGWVAGAGSETVTFHGKKGLGTLRISAWRTDGSAGLDEFLARKEQELASPTPAEKEVLAVERFALKDKRGLFRISVAEEGGVPLWVATFLLGGGATVVAASHILPLAQADTPAGNGEQRAVRDALLRMVLR